MTCGAKFYDLNRTPITCPKCGTPFQAAPLPADSPDKVDYDRLARVVSGLEQVIRDWVLVRPAAPL